MIYPIVFLLLVVFVSFFFLYSYFWFNFIFKFFWKLKKSNVCVSFHSFKKKKCTKTKRETKKGQIWNNEKTFRQRNHSTNFPKSIKTRFSHKQFNKEKDNSNNYQRYISIFDDYLISWKMTTWQKNELKKWQKLK